MNWTHEGVSISDIRKLPNFYTFTIKNLPFVLTVKKEIFNDRLTSFFIKPIDEISREDILAVRWNMYITQGYYVKIKKEGDEFKIVKYERDPSEYYVSYLEINGGGFDSLGNFSYILKNMEQQSKKDLE